MATAPRAVIEPDSLVMGYLGLRKAIGIIGLMLPFLLAIGNFVAQPLLRDPRPPSGLQDSISYYYYTDMGNVFVGSLCAIGIFLLSYRGYEKQDRVAGILACIFAVGVALFPTKPDGVTTMIDGVIGVLHYASAGLLFLTLAYFSLKLFTKTAPHGTMTKQKKQRNNVYRVAGYTILVCIILILVLNLTLSDDALHRFKPTFFLEALAIIAFGASWLVKGEAILKDQQT
jgi:hypothetical protein